MSNLQILGIIACIIIIAVIYYALDALVGTYIVGVIFLIIGFYFFSRKKHE